MKVAGVNLPAGAAALLAVHLQRAGEDALAQYVGRAVDNSRDALSFDRRDRERVIGALDHDCPESLGELQAALIKHRSPRG